MAKGEVAHYEQECWSIITMCLIRQLILEDTCCILISKAYHLCVLICYLRSTTFKEMGKEVNVPYTQGSWNGILGQDYVTISSLPNSTVFATIACIDESDDFFINNSRWQGIMGLAFAGIARVSSLLHNINYDE